MKLLKANIPPNCDIVIHGDTHIGSELVAKSALFNLLESVRRSKNTFLIHMGDAVEAITTDDKRFTAESTEDPIPLQQAEFVADLYKPIKDRILCWLWGNHETKLERFGNLTRDCILKDLGRRDIYGSWTAKLRLDVNGKQAFKMFLSHGFRCGISSNAKDFEQQQANMKASLKRMLIHKASDCLVMGIGDTHKLLLVPPAERLMMKDDGKQVVSGYLRGGDGRADYIEPDCRWYFNSGSFLRLHVPDVEGYAERAGYDPTELGYIVAHVRGGKLDSMERVVV